MQAALAAVLVLALTDRSALELTKISIANPPAAPASGDAAVALVLAASGDSDASETASVAVLDPVTPGRRRSDGRRAGAGRCRGCGFRRRTAGRVARRA
jgi:hypothetical protein